MARVCAPTVLSRFSVALPPPAGTALCPAPSDDPDESRNASGGGLIPSSISSLHRFHVCIGFSSVPQISGAARDNLGYKYTITAT